MVSAVDTSPARALTQSRSGRLAWKAALVAALAALPLVAPGYWIYFAGLLGITETTVRFHIDNARRKLGAKNRAQAVARLANLRLL